MGVEQQPITGDQMYLLEELASVRPGAGRKGGT